MKNAANGSGTTPCCPDAPWSFAIPKTDGMKSSPRNPWNAPIRWRGSGRRRCAANCSGRRKWATTAWLRPSFGTVTTANGERFDIEAVEFADDISGVMIDEIDPGSGRIVTEHLFDWDCKPMTGLSEFRTRREADLAAEVVRLKAEIEALKARGVK